MLFGKVQVWKSSFKPKLLHLFTVLVRMLFGIVPRSPTQPKWKSPTSARRRRSSPTAPLCVRSPVRTWERPQPVCPPPVTTVSLGVSVRPDTYGTGKTACQDWSVRVTMAASRTRRGKSTIRSVTNGELGVWWVGGLGEGMDGENHLWWVGGFGKEWIGRIICVHEQ